MPGFTVPIIHKLESRKRTTTYRGKLKLYKNSNSNGKNSGNLPLDLHKDAVQYMQSQTKLPYIYFYKYHLRFHVLRWWRACLGLLNTCKKQASVTEV